MRIRSENAEDTFCYHLDNAPIRDCGDEALRIFGYLALSSLRQWQDHVNTALEIDECFAEEIRITQYPLGHLTIREQSMACTAAQIAIFNGGYQVENMILEQLIQETMYQNYTVACDERRRDDPDLKSWARLRAIFDGRKKLSYLEGGDEEWGFCFSDWPLFWDEDWEIFPLDPEHIAEARNDLKYYEGFKAESLIPKNVWRAVCAGCSLRDEDYSWLKMGWSVAQAVKMEHPEVEWKRATKSIANTGRTGRSINKPGFVYCISEQGGKFKIGKTALSPESRLKALQTANPSALKLCFAIKHEQPDRIERRIHGELKQFRVSGEWFNCGEEAVQAAFRSVEDAEWVNL